MPNWDTIPRDQDHLKELFPDGPEEKDKDLYETPWADPEGLKTLADDRASEKEEK